MRPALLWCVAVALTASILAALFGGAAQAADVGGGHIGSNGVPTTISGNKTFSGSITSAVAAGANAVIVPDNAYIDVSSGAGSVRWRYNTSTSRGEFDGTHAFTGTLSAASVAIPNSGGTPITKSYGASATIDFGSTTTTCNDSTAITVTGAVAGDACFVGPPTTGGSTNASYTCYVSATNNVKVRHCAAGTADDPASATFYVRVFSQQ